MGCGVVPPRSSGLENQKNPEGFEPLGPENQLGDPRAKQTRFWAGRRTKLPEPVPRERKPGKPARLCGFLACRSCLFPDYGESDQSTVRRNRADAAADGASCWAGLLVPSWNVHAAPHDAASKERSLLTGLCDRTEPSQPYSKRQR